jgi:predicted metalloprotease with PDZ domain
LQGTTWGDRYGFPSFLRLRIGESTSAEELAADWIITHELVHTALASLPDEQHWLEEGLASYIEPIARVQAGELTAVTVWTDMVHGMPNGEPGPGDRGLNNTHTWGRTYWGGALFCLMADVQIRQQTGNRRGLQDALRAIVAAGGTIDKEWPLTRLLTIGDRATGTYVLEKMYAQWAGRPVNVDLPALWEQLGVQVEPKTVVFHSKAPLAAIRTAMTEPVGSKTVGNK